MQLTRRRALALATSGAFAVVAGPGIAAGAILRVGGNGSATELLHVLGLEFHKRNGTSFSIVPGLGSSGGILAAGDKALDLGVSARLLKPEESKGELVTSQFARTPFVFATSYVQPGSLSVRQIARMISDPQSTWSDGTPVRAILRPRGGSHTSLLARYFPEIGQAIDDARKRQDVPVAVDDRRNAEMAERTPGSLIAITMAQLKLAPRHLHVIALNGVAPTLSNLEVGTYPFGRDFYLVHARAPSADVADFIAFVRSGDGVRLLRQHDCLPMA